MKGKFFYIRIGVQIVAVAAYLAAALNCWAEEPGPTKLSLNDAIAEALKSNANIKQAEEDHLSSLSSLRIAGFHTSSQFGTLTELDRDSLDTEMSTRTFASLSYDGLSGTEASIQVSPFGLGNERSSLGMSLRHPLMSGRGLMSKKSDILSGAKNSAVIQEKQLYLSRQATVLGVIEAYYNAILAREQVTVQENAVSISEEAADGARRRAEAGLVPEIDVSRAEIRVAQTKDTLNLQKQSAKGAVDRLMVAIGYGVGRSIELVDQMPNGDVQVPSLGDAVKTALDNRAELAVYDTSLDDQKRKIALATDSLRPKLDVVGGFNSTRGEEGIFSRSLINLGAFELGLEYTLPTDKRIERENLDTASRGINVLESLRLLQMERIADEVRTAYRSVESSRTSVEIYSQNLQVAKDNLTLAQRMVEEGLDDNRNVLEAQDSLTQLESGLLSAQVELYLAGVNLKSAMGEDLTVLESK